MFVNLGHTAGAGANTFTTSPAVDTTGADLITITLTENGVGAAAISDSKGNTWVRRTPKNVSTPCKVILDCKNPTVGTGHTFTATGSSIFATIEVDWWSGADISSPFDQENGDGTTGGSMTSGWQPGSVTPISNNQLVLAGLSWNNAWPVITSVTGMPNLAQTAFAGGTNYGGARAYVIQTTAAAINPAWNATGFSGTDGNGVVATYKAATGGGGGGTKSTGLALTGAGI